MLSSIYVEAATPIHTAKALYDYTRQTEEEVSFSEDATIQVYDISDPDWTLVAVDGDYGFAPANYIEIGNAASKPAGAKALAYASPDPEQEPSPPASPAHDPQSPAANLARVLGGIAPASPPATRNIVSPPLPSRRLTPPSDEESAPALPRRPQSQVIPSAQAATYSEYDSPNMQASQPYLRSPALEDTPLRSPGGYHLYNISEMVSAMGKRKKIPITLGLNIATGTIMLSPEKSRDGPTQEWTADKLDHYSMEGKHVFLELNRPNKSLDLHAGAKDTAQEIMGALGEIAGAHRAEGLKEIISAASAGSQRKGVVVYDFMAQGDDEVTVAEGDEVVVLDDMKSDEWWNVRRVKNGKEGVVPSSYIEITGTVPIESSSRSGVNAGKSPVEQNRLEEERLAKEAARTDRARREAEQSRGQREISLPERGSSLADEEHRSSKKDRKSGKADAKPRSKPDTSKVRTWTDHSGSFKVDAQFIGVADGKIHLHKVNGVKIAVPVAKMSPADLEYVEKVTNESIDDNIPVADLIKMKRRNQASDSNRAGASIENSTKPQSQVNKPPDYDWFDFFLSAGVGVNQCERYAQAMIKDSMDESILPDIQMETLRMLGLKEGDALKVMKYLDHKYSRTSGQGQAEGGIFAGPGGALKNNTGRQRPEATRSAGDTVDPSAFNTEQPNSLAETKPTPRTNAPTREVRNEFDDNAWEVKPSTRSAPAPASQPIPTPVIRPPSENLQALSLLDQPLQPTIAYAPPPGPAPQPQAPPQAPPQQPALTGATPQIFQQVANATQQSGVGIAPPRQRPQAPQQAYTGSALLAPPPRPTSAPLNPQQSQFGLQPLQPQLTGVANATHPAPPGQSLEELAVQRMQQYLRPQQTGFMQQPSLQMQNGFQPQPTGFQSQQQFGQMQQPYLNGNAAGSPFADPRSTMQPQPTGFGSFQQQNLAVGGINSLLPPALAPQRTGFPNMPQPQMQQANGFNQFQPQATGFAQQQPFQPQQTGFPQTMQPQPTGFGQTNGFGQNNFPPAPPIPQSTVPAPLVPQQTGPAPEIRFGMPAAKKLAPQPTGRRANLSQASKFDVFSLNDTTLTILLAPQNPFGF